MRSLLFLLLFGSSRFLSCSDIEITEDAFQALKENFSVNRESAEQELRQNLEGDNSEEYLRALVKSGVINFKILADNLPKNIEFLSYALCLQKNENWDTLMSSGSRNAFGFGILINERFAESSLNKVPISMAIENRYKREELSQIFFDAQLALDKGEKSYEVLKQEAISKIENLVNDPEFLADPRFWQPVSSKENAVGKVGGPPAKQTDHAVSKIGGYEAEYQPKENPRSLSWLYWMLGALILGGVGVLAWNSRKGSSAV